MALKDELGLDLASVLYRVPYVQNCMLDSCIKLCGGSGEAGVCELCDQLHFELLAEQEYC